MLTWPLWPSDTEVWSVSCWPGQRTQGLGALLQIQMPGIQCRRRGDPAVYS